MAAKTAQWILGWFGSPDNSDTESVSDSENESEADNEESDDDERDDHVTDTRETPTTFQDTAGHRTVPRTNFARLTEADILEYTFESKRKIIMDYMENLIEEGEVDNLMRFIIKTQKSKEDTVLPNPDSAYGSQKPSKISKQDTSANNDNQKSKTKSRAGTWDAGKNRTTDDVGKTEADKTKTFRGGGGGGGSTYRANIVDEEEDASRFGGAGSPGADEENTKMAYTSLGSIKHEEDIDRLKNAELKSILNIYDVQIKDFEKENLKKEVRNLWRTEQKSNVNEQKQQFQSKSTIKRLESIQSEEDISRLDVKTLKEILRNEGIDTSFCSEKSELEKQVWDLYLKRFK